ncbi:MAG: ABC transporter substrate-binding protein [Planctomycetes bacterium]|nr:ABC transporter substrate-binding protein [Planctomycetota bacterium]
MLKHFLITGIVLAVILNLTACGKAEQGNITLRFLDAADTGGAWKSLITEFEQSYPNIKVELVEGPAATNSREDMYARSFMAGESVYDMVYMDIIWVPKFASAGWISPLDEFFTPEEQAKFLPGDIAGSKYQQKIYRVPVRTDAGMLYYRKDILEAHNLKPPQTWDELNRIAIELQKPPELYGFTFQGMQYEGLICCFLEILWGGGTDLMDESNQIVIDSPQAIESLTWLCDLVNRYKIVPPDITKYQEEDARRLFQEGHAIFMRNWPYAWTLAQGIESPIKDKIGIIPMVHKEGQRSAATLGGWGFAIAQSSPNKQAAWKFIQFVSGEKGQKIMHFKNGAIPTLHGLFKDAEIISESPHYSDLYKVLLTARPRPGHPSYAHISDILQLYVSSALVGKETPESALKKAAQEIRQLLK